LEHTRIELKIVVDTAGFLAGYISTIYGAKVYTVKEVIDEVKDVESRERLELMLGAGKVEVCEPTSENIEKARAVASSEKILEALSEADQKLLALAIELKEKGYNVMLVTDDSYLHALAKKLGILSKGVRRESPKKFRPRIYMCRVCGYSSVRRIDKCPSCGSTIKIV
jgi:rRNA maturation endonuclease Nob1